MNISFTSDNIKSFRIFYEFVASDEFGEFDLEVQQFGHTADQKILKRAALIEFYRPFLHDFQLDSVLHSDLKKYINGFQYSYRAFLKNREFLFPGEALESGNSEKEGGEVKAKTPKERRLEEKRKEFEQYKLVFEKIKTTEFYIYLMKLDFESFEIKFNLEAEIIEMLKTIKQLLIQTEKYLISQMGEFNLPNEHLNLVSLKSIITMFDADKLKKSNLEISEKVKDIKQDLLEAKQPLSGGMQLKKKIHR